MKVKFKENRTIAWIVLACVVLICISQSGGAGLRSLRRTAVDTFHNGVNNDGLSIYNDLQKRVDCAYNLASIADRYDNIPQNFIDEVEQAALSMESDGDSDIVGLKVDNNKLNRAVEDLYTELENTELSQADSTFALGQYKEFTSRGLTITRDGYNSRAEEFNAVLDNFPASLVAKLSGVKALELFR